MNPQTLPAGPAQAPAEWIIEPRYTTVHFSVKNLFFFTVEGDFTDFRGELARNEQELGHSRVATKIRASSIETRNRRRDRHLTSADFLEVERYPEILFQSTRVEKGRDRDALIVTGILTIKGRSKEVVLNVTETDHSRSPQGEEVAYYLAQTKVDRFDFGITYGRWMIGRSLKITIQAQATRQARSQ
ncbi:MAG TPA: YceI family protein [Blastocatellia bacterium]|nr:YceI family protein [Blastocatellia bacterium]